MNQGFSRLLHICKIYFLILRIESKLFLFSIKIFAVMFSGRIRQLLRKNDLNAEQCFYNPNKK